MTADRVNGTSNGVSSGVTNRGYTGHEMLDNVALVHMNGRVYDPMLGRFLSVDPVFQFPTNTQSLNPYTYVLNNPLSMTDPTGYAAYVCIEDMGCVGGEGNRDDKGNLIKNDSNVKVDDMKVGKQYQVGNTTVMKDADGNVTVGPGSNGTGAAESMTGAQTKATTTTAIGSPGNVAKSGQGLFASWNDGGNQHSINLGETPIGGATSWTQGDSYVSTYTAEALDAKFPVTGGTDRQRAEVKNDIMRIAQTNRGSVLFDKALRQATLYPTEIVDDKMPNSVPGAGPAMVNPENAPLEWMRSIHEFTPDLMRQVAHELFGHFIDGVGDTGPDRMDNVRRNENPIMMEIYPQQGDRLRYP